MTAVQAGAPQSPPELPEGRYGPGPDARADRRLRIAGIAAGALALAVIGWFGYSSLTTSKVSAQVVAFDVVSDQQVQIHLEVHKKPGDVAVCTVRSVDSDHNEVGRKDVRLSRHGRQVDTVVALRTTARGETGELVGCQKAPHTAR
jgi:hypothetical protein